MKHLIVTVLLVLVGSFAAIAGEPKVCEPPLVSQNVAAEIATKYAKMKGYCDQPRANLKKGEIAIEWHYDAQGNCTIQKARVGK